MKSEGLAEVDLERSVDFGCLDELWTGVHDVPDKPKSVRDVGLEEREDIIGRRWVFERGQVDGHPSRVCV